MSQQLEEEELLFVPSLGIIFCISLLFAEANGFCLSQFFIITSKAFTLICVCVYKNIRFFTIEREKKKRVH